jgi:integrase
LNRKELIVARNVRRRRTRRGSAWHWKQTDCWYYTLPGEKRRVALFDEQGKRIRGKDNKQAAELALARAKLNAKWRQQAVDDGSEANRGEAWPVARVCSAYLEHCRKRVAAGAMSAGHLDDSTRYLNEFCKYAGALAANELTKGQVQFWLETHPTWGSVTRRNVIAVLLAAFNHALREHGLSNPLKGLKKPPLRPRLDSFSAADEESLYQATDHAFKDFLFAAIHTGLRPFCELARLTAEDVEQTPRGMLWRVYASKTKKTRKIPVRPEVADLVRRLMETAPRGSGKPLFRNPQDNPWKKVTGVARFLKIKTKLGWNRDATRSRYCCYTCRHTFAHRMLSGYWNGGAGCSIETLAELLGDTPKVAFDHYGREWAQHYQEPLWAAMGLGKPKSASPRKGS